MLMEYIFDFFHLTSLASKKSKVKSVTLFVCQSYRTKIVLANQIAGFQIKYISRAN